jgi:ABC-type branched-subunit amino acid transport system substrate-binding protein
LAANSTNSERAFQLAIESANALGGVGGRRLRIIARDTRSDPAKVAQPAQALLDDHVALFIGPDTSDLAVELREMLLDQTAILPSYVTAHSNFRRPDWWFVMGAGTARIACELKAQIDHDKRQHPVVLTDASGYDSLIGWELTRRYGMPRLELPDDGASNSDTIVPIMQAGADAFLLIAPPRTASSLVYAMAAIGALGDPTRWYLSPTLHSPVLLETIPKGALDGARGVAPGTMVGAADFRALFKARWDDTPLDDAYAFYDAGAIAVLAMGRSMARQGSIATGKALAAHVTAVTHPGSVRVAWNELDRGIRLLDEGQEIEYLGLTGLIEFDVSGQTATASTRWWTIGPDGFKDLEAGSCDPGL